MDGPLFPRVRENDRTRIESEEMFDMSRRLHALRVACWSKILHTRNDRGWIDTPLAEVLRGHKLSQYRRPDSIAEKDKYNEALFGCRSVCEDEGTLAYIEAVRQLRARMASGNLGLVGRYVRSPCGFMSDDLWQEGVKGLLRAVDRFDPDRGFKFSTYATYWVRHFIRRYRQDHSRTVRIPNHLWQKQEKLDRALNSTHAIELDAAIGVRDPDCPIEQTESMLDTHEVLKALDELPARARAIIVRRFGLDGDGPSTLQEIATEEGISRERIRQLQNRAIVELRIALDRRARDLRSGGDACRD